jgi:cellulose synthase/poly-beta-1,6-N-acetylglucosamine synthase-like glycosyltransferase
VITAGWFLILLPVALLSYAYLLYPAILWVAAQKRRMPRVRHEYVPFVSIVVPAYNEEAQIRGSIEALIRQDYPADHRQILIVSDASTDHTDEIVAEYESAGVELLRMPARGGKTAAENASVSLLRGEIIVNSDASVRLHPAAVRLLVEAMADPGVGVASTRDISVVAGADVANVTEAGYVDYEMRVRHLESLTGGIVGASGSGYAIRANLHRIPVRADLSRDFSAALTARSHGYAAVSADGALCYVPRTTSLKAEYRRKVRTIARGAETLRHNSHLLDPTKFGVFAWKLISHKVCRWLVPVFAILGALGLALLAPSHRWAVAALVAAGLGAIVAAIGARWPATRPMPRILSTFTFAAAANVAVIHALSRVFLGHEDHLWEPTRRAPTPANS